jgi:hypothetical protein
MNEIKDKEKIKELIINFLETNPIIEFVCRKVQITRTTYYRWLEKDSKFKEACENAIKNGKLVINDLAYSKLIELIKSGNITAIIYWLKNNHPDFTEKNQQIKIVQEKLSLEQSRLLEKALYIINNKNYEKK